MHGFVQGTLDFMAAEVESETYSFLPPSDLSSDTAIEFPVFRYNFLHDLESLWWVALWMIFNHRDDRDDAAHSNAERQAGCARMLFPRITLPYGRLSVLQNNATLYRAMANLPTPCPRVV